MEQMAEKIKKAQENINRQRVDQGILPTEEFVTAEYRNGFITMPVENFNGLPKYKKKKILKGAMTCL